jgi:two-component system chemotaxis response regulator CheB
MVVDDTVLYRKIVSDALAILPGVEVVGSAHNGKAAIAKLASLKPDLLTLDIEMPEMNGLEVLDHIQHHAPHIGAIMLSTLTQEGGAMTMKALELGAFDFIPKPQSGGMAENREKIEAALAPMLQAFRRSARIPGMVQTQSSVRRKIGPAFHGPDNGNTAALPAILKRSKAEIIAIGISTGGPKALAKMLPMIPKTYRRSHSDRSAHAPHVHPFAGQQPVRQMRHRRSGKPNREKPIEPNTALIAPGGKQMKIVAGADGKTARSRSPTIRRRTAANPVWTICSGRLPITMSAGATGVIMTGMGSDGTEG